jgi:hypothetical protein
MRRIFQINEKVVVTLNYDGIREKCCCIFDYGQMMKIVIIHD